MAWHIYVSKATKRVMGVGTVGDSGNPARSVAIQHMRRCIGLGIRWLVAMRA